MSEYEYKGFLIEIESIEGPKPFRATVTLNCEALAVFEDFTSDLAMMCARTWCSAYRIGQTVRKIVGGGS